jgi:transposase-like protein
MKTASAQPCTITLARRALLVQRVLVDGWTSAKAAAAFGVSERQIEVWVAEFRRYGMTSLRREPGKTFAAEMAHVTILQPLRGIASKIASGLRRLLLRKRLPPPLPLQRFNDNHRSGD